MVNSYFDNLSPARGLKVWRAIMNKLTTQKRIQVVAPLVEGAIVNSVVRMTGVSKPTILKLLVDLGTTCAKYQDEKLRNLPCKRVQADEIWSFCFAKDKNLSDEMKGKFGFGSVWTGRPFAPIARS